MKLHKKYNRRIWVLFQSFCRSSALYSEHLSRRIKTKTNAEAPGPTPPLPSWGGGRGEGIENGHVLKGWSIRVESKYERGNEGGKRTGLKQGSKNKNKRWGIIETRGLECGVVFILSCPAPFLKFWCYPLRACAVLSPPAPFATRRERLLRGGKGRYIGVPETQYEGQTLARYEGQTLAPKVEEKVSSTASPSRAMRVRVCTSTGWRVAA